MPLTPANSKPSPLVVVEDLHVCFQATGTSQTEPVKGLSFEIAQGEMLALVGESGSGKSLTAHSILKLLPDHARYQGRILFNDEDVLQASAQRLQQFRVDVYFQIEGVVIIWR